VYNMANYKRDKLGRQEKAYRDKLKNDAVKNIDEPERKRKDTEDIKKLWKKFCELKEEK
tara:strand:+ start:385 stop:561 length:177 start_codon:yes stop_codon:yes gene_type:complete